MATPILISSTYDCENDCKQIHNSSKTLANATLDLANRSQHQRRQIRETYKKMYNVELTTHLLDTRKRHDNVAAVEVLSMWMSDPHKRDAMVAREALEKAASGGGCGSFMAVVEIFVGRKSSHVQNIRQAYFTLFSRWLDQDLLQIEPPHPFQRILVALASSHKAHQVYISQGTAKSDAMRLYETGEGRSGTVEEAVVLEILCKRSIPQLKHTFSCYKHIYGHSYTKSLVKQNSREFEDALKMVVKCMCNPAKYYAKLLNASLKGQKEETRQVTTRVMVSRAEIDMADIQTIFKKKYGIELRDFIIQNTLHFGHYFTDFLVALVTRRTSFTKDFTLISS